MCYNYTKGDHMRLLVVLLLVSNVFAYEFERNSANKPVKWDKTSITWKLNDPSLRQATTAALEEWAKATGYYLHFEETSSADADIKVELDSSLAGYLGQTATYYDPPTTTILNSTVQVKWPMKPILLHEIGHALGMAHATGNYQGHVDEYDLPVMFNVIEAYRGSLHLDDILGIRALYGLTLPVPTLGVSISNIKGGLYHLEAANDVSWYANDRSIYMGKSIYKKFRRGTYSIVARYRGIEETYSLIVGSGRRRKE